MNSQIQMFQQGHTRIDKMINFLFILILFILLVIINCHEIFIQKIIVEAHSPNRPQINSNSIAFPNIESSTRKNK